MSEPSEAKSDTSTPGGDPAPDDDGNATLAATALSENMQAFRALNTQMWQVPIIGMTLIGGLWFGVFSAKPPPPLAAGLLLFAAAGCAGLIVVLERVRFVLGRYLSWIEERHPYAHIGDTDGPQWYHKAHTVKLAFQCMLGLAAGLSVTLALVSLQAMHSTSTDMTALAYYEAHAEAKAAAYDRFTSESLHPLLADMSAPGPGARALDVGAGSGRDARWLTERGYRVTAVEPAPSLLALARAKSKDLEEIDWQQSELPFLPGLASAERYDLIVLSAVWMHVHPSEREAAFATLRSRLAENGVLYITLRIGPSDPKRGIHAVSRTELNKLANAQGLEICRVNRAEDMQGRPDIRWENVLLAETCLR